MMKHSSMKTKTHKVNFVLLSHLTKTIFTVLRKQTVANQTEISCRCERKRIHFTNRQTQLNMNKRLLGFYYRPGFKTLSKL